jgi:hypothetical protein
MDKAIAFAGELRGDIFFALLAAGGEKTGRKGSKLTKNSLFFYTILILGLYEQNVTLFAGWAKSPFPSVAPALVSPNSQPPFFLLSLVGVILAGSLDFTCCPYGFFPI